MGKGRGKSLSKTTGYIPFLVQENYFAWRGARESPKSKGMQESPLQLLAIGAICKEWAISEISGHSVRNVR